jgi:ATP-dependent RNA helicase DDX56/DBP9
VEDVARSITKTVVKDARLRELRAEVLNSSSLSGYFEEHAAERQLLRHDGALHVQPQVCYWCPA